MDRARVGDERRRFVGCGCGIGECGSVMIVEAGKCGCANFRVLMDPSRTWVGGKGTVTVGGSAGSCECWGGDCGGSGRGP